MAGIILNVSSSAAGFLNPEGEPFRMQVMFAGAVEQQVSAVQPRPG